MVDAIAVALSRAMVSPLKVGKLIRMACGRITRRKIKPFDMPNARAASISPCGTARMAPRRISPE